MMNIASTTINRRKQHLTSFINLCPQERTSRILLYHLSRIEIITHFLISRIFLENEFFLDSIQHSLFYLHHTIQISHGFLLLVQVNLLHKSDSRLSHVYRLRIKRTNTVYLQFRQAIIAIGKRHLCTLKQFACILLVGTTRRRHHRQHSYSKYYLFHLAK